MTVQNTTIIRRAVILLLLSVFAFAHGGQEHVLGTVTKISDTSVSVKTAAGKIVDVNFDAKTTYTKNDQPLQKSEIKIGDRLVIHAEKSGTSLVAHTVQLGAAPAKSAAKH